MADLQKLITHGQSYWMDNLTRTMLRSGQLKKQVRNEGLRGITSNPKIFDSAIAGSDAYDDQIRAVHKETSEVREVYEALVVKDVQDACDELRSVYDASEGADGFVSLEVSPHIAYDAEATMEDVRRLHAAVNRPNVLIKIPGTSEGLHAIEQMLYEGININVTLLFSIERYEEVALAYIRALEHRLSEGKEIGRVSSVASFFLSRIDVLVDQLLRHRVGPRGNAQGNGVHHEHFFGQAAIANARLAYQSFLQIFSGPTWKRLEEKGGRVQRVLWASTSTKNPEYSDVKYVEPLIGRHTVNTMPEKTISAFADHGTIRGNTIAEDLGEAKRVLNDLHQLGIDIGFVTRQLMNEGIQKFIDPFDDLLKSIEKRMTSIRKNTVTSGVHT